MLLEAVKIGKDTLRSSLVREIIGERFFDITATGESKDDGGGIGTLFNSALRFTGFLVKAAFGAIVWTATAVVGLLVRAYFAIKFFDWNQTDASIRSQMEANNAAIAGSLGSLSATGLVWLTGIAVAGGLTAKFPVLAGQVALRLAEEGGEEIRSELTNLLSNTRQAVINNLILGLFLTLRKLRWFGLAPVTEAKEPWTFAEKIDELIEKIPDRNIRTFVESFLDQLEESIIEMGYVIAFTLDDYYAAQKAAQGALQERTVVFMPDKNAPDEKVIIEGGQSNVVETLQNALVQHTFIHNRDVGMIFGQEITELAKTPPSNNASELTLKIQFYGAKEPPWKRNGKWTQRAQTSIPNVKRSKLDWQAIKLACGSANGYLWGRFYGIGKLANSSGAVVDEIKVWAATGEEAEERIIALAALSDYELVAVNCTEERNYGRRSSGKVLYKETTRVYPAYFTLVNSQKILNEASGKTTLSGTYKKQQSKILLYPSEKPDNFERVIAELLKTPGVDV
jgi:hypothetical protein